MSLDVVFVSPMSPLAVAAQSLGKAEVGSSILPGGTTLSPLFLNVFSGARGGEAFPRECAHNACETPMTRLPYRSPLFWLILLTVIVAYGLFS